MTTKTLYFSYLLLFFFLFSFTGNSQSCSDHHHPSESQQKDALLFIPNQNQWDAQIEYRVDFGGVHSLFLEDRALTWLFNDPAAIKEMHDKGNGYDSLTLASHAYKVHFVGAAAAKISGQKRRESYNNYFLGNDANRWASKVPVFEKVLYQGLYEGIEMAAYSQDGHFKYDFLLDAGVDPAVLQLAYEGADHLYLKNGNLHIQTSIEQITEQKPFAYQIIDGLQQQVICEYNLNNNILTFDFPEGYNNTLPLVIDPVVVAATLSGATSDNWGFTATYDNSGNIFAGGASFDPGYPTTMGAFQNTYGGGQRDIAVTKYNPNGSEQIFATYIGGSGTEQPHSMIVDFNGQLCIYGTSNSNNYPTTVNAVQPSIGGSTDIVVTKLNADGTGLVGSTYLGGTNDDGLNTVTQNFYDDNRGEIVLDAQGNIHIASSSSSSNYPTTANAFQTTSGGAQDAVITKLNSDLSVLFWSTYIGTNQSDAGMGLRVTEDGKVLVTGVAGSASFPVGDDGFASIWPGGSYNSYIVQLSTDGQQIERGTFFGSPDGQDFSFFLDLDEDNNVHIYGQTDGTINITPNTYFSTIGSKQFLAGFTADLSDLIYSTVIGNGPSTNNFDFIPVAFMVDKCNGIYFSAFQASSGLPTTPDAVESGGNNVFYLAKLSPNAEELDFGTYYGDAFHVDGGTSRFDKAGIVYQAVCSCPGSVMNTLPNAYAPTNNGSPNCNIGVFKIDFEIPTVTAAAFAAPSTSGCVPLTIDFQYTGSDAETFFWDFGTGATSTEENPTYTFTEAGTYTIMQVVNAPNTCNAVDTFFLQIDVLNNSSSLTDTIFCPGAVDLFLDVSTANANYQWQDGNSGATYQVNSPGTYWVDVNIGTCSRRDSFLVASSSEIEIALGQDGTFCDTSAITLDASHPLAAVYQWNTGGMDANLIVSSSGQYVVTLFDSIGCFTMDTINLDFNDTPIIDLGPDLNLCEGEELLLDVMTTGATYSWQDGSMNPTFTTTSSGTFTVAVDVNGCVATDEMTVVFSPPLPLDLGPDQSVCDDLSFSLNANTAEVSSYEWNDGTTNPTLDIVSSGNYILTITNALGCETVDDINIIFSLTPTIELVADTLLCEGETLTLTPSVTAGVPYFWQDGSGIAIYVVDSPGIYWAIADADGCTDVDSIIVGYTPLPVVDFDLTDVYCYGDSTASITAINPTSITDYDFIWSTGSTNPDLENLPTGNYGLTVTDEYDCIYETELVIGQPDPLALLVDPRNIVCFGDGDGYIAIDSTGGGIPPYLYSINFDTLTGNTIYGNLNGGLYTVLVQDANDCIFSMEIDLYEPPEVFLSAGEDKSILLGDSVQIDGSLFPDFNQVINWTSVEYVNCPGCIRPHGIPLYTADYIITAIDSITGCTRNDTMLIMVDKPRNIYIPNAFSPNGNGTNDLFFPYGDISAEKVLLFRVYDRWGELVHEARDFDLGDPAGGWNGMLKGKVMNPGVFAYVVEVEFVDGVQKRYKGDVSLLR